MLFSVVIPSFNRRGSLGACLDALALQSVSSDTFEVIVVDDGSTDGTSDMVRARRERFALSCVSVPNGGASRARNKGISAARGEVIALTEDDVIPDRDWLKHAARYFQDGAFDVLEGVTRYIGTEEAVRRFEPGATLSFIPCNLFLRRGVFEKAGGYDPDFFDGREHLYFREDTEMGFRILDEGFRAKCAPDVLVEHPRQFSSLAECFRHARRYVFDPLLSRKHPVRFRTMIETKKIAGVTLHRPLHYVALVYAAAVVSMLLGIALSQWVPAITAAAVAFIASQIFRGRYRGLGALRLDRVAETAAFCALPAVYLTAIARGSIRYRWTGALW